MASVPFPSAPYPPNTAFVCCSSVLTSASPQCVSCVALHGTSLVASKVLEQEKLLKAGPGSEGTRSSPWMTFAHVKTDYLEDEKKDSRDEKETCPTMVLLR